MARPSAAQLQKRHARSKRKVEQPDYSPKSTKIARGSTEIPKSHAPAPTPSQEHWIEFGEGKDAGFSESEVEISEGEQEVDMNEDVAAAPPRFESALKTMMETAKRYAFLLGPIPILYQSLANRMFSDPSTWKRTIFKYQRGHELHRKTIWEHEKKKKEVKKIRDNEKILKISKFLKPATSACSDRRDSSLSTSKPNSEASATDLPENPTTLELEMAIKLLEAKLRKKGLTGQNLMRHRAVLIFLNFQLSAPPVVPHSSKSKAPTRLDYAILSANAFRRGVYLGRKIITWERQWRDIHVQAIEEGRRGCHSKTQSWFNDEGVQLAAREFIRDLGVGFSAYKLAKAISEYLDSNRSQGILEEAFADAGIAESDANSILGRPGAADGRKTRRIKARTARNWLYKMGFRHCRITKNVFVDGHERDDVVEYRNDIFLPNWLRYRQRMVQFDEDGGYKLPSECKLGSDGNYYFEDGTRPLVLVTHDESTFNANDGKKSGWFKVGEDGKAEMPIQPKSRGKGIMVSLFLTPGGILSVPEQFSDLELMMDPGHPKLDGKPLRQAIKYLEYGKDNYWTGDMMVDQTIYEALPIFKRAFPRFKALFAFDNASNHCAYAPDALVVERMNLNPGGKAPHMHETFFYREDRTMITQPMSYPENHDNYLLRGKAKGMKAVLEERGLWPSNGRNGIGERFLADCPTNWGRPGCPDGLTDDVQKEIVGRCCARTLLRNQQDFKEQKGRLETEINERSHLIIFYPKFHCELNFIERFWAGAKYYARENCQYDFAGLRSILPDALHSVTIKSINRYYKHCERLIDAYSDPQRFKYGTKGFSDRVYSGHRQVIDKTKW